MPSSTLQGMPHAGCTGASLEAVLKCFFLKNLQPTKSGSRVSFLRSNLSSLFLTRAHSLRERIRMSALRLFAFVGLAVLAEAFSPGPVSLSRQAGLFGCNRRSHGHSLPQRHALSMINAGNSRNSADERTARLLAAKAASGKSWDEASVLCNGFTAIRAWFCRVLTYPHNSVISLADRGRTWAPECVYLPAFPWAGPAQAQYR